MKDDGEIADKKKVDAEEEDDWETVADRDEDDWECSVSGFKALTYVFYSHVFASAFLIGPAQN